MHESFQMIIQSEFGVAWVIWWLLLVKMFAEINSIIANDNDIAQANDTVRDNCWV